jgi:hypothetical protein
LNYSISSLKDWLNVHPFKDQQDKPLFVCIEHGDGNQKHRYGKRLEGQTVLRIIKQATKDAGINKRVYVHLFRHSRNTDLEDKGAPRSARIFMFGWSPKSNMPEHYSHLSKEQNVDKIRIADGLKPQPQLVDLLKPILCPRCSEQNSPTNKYCGKCAMPLDKEAMQEMKMFNVLKKMIVKYPEVKAIAQEVAD